uniref:Uncharacterized protein n=1 Tax=Avena sativa TaxID=4498 RepID=A0ACD5ZUS2_AVESA
MALAQLKEQALFVGVAAGNAGVELELDDHQSRFVNRVRRRMEASAEELGAVAKVFDVPKLLRATRPEAYTPQHFAIGPYHYQRPELRDMERYKLAAAKRAEKLFAGDKKFDDLVHKFVGMQEMIRDPYNRLMHILQLVPYKPIALLYKDGNGAFLDGYPSSGLASL